MIVTEPAKTANWIAATAPIRQQAIRKIRLRERGRQVVIGWGVEIAMPSQAVARRTLVVMFHPILALNRGEI